MNKEDVKIKLEKAFALLLKNDFSLFKDDANERSLTHKLAENLQKEFPEWNVDCEYNRDGNIPKRLNFNSEQIGTDDTNAVTVYPDIIIHHRGTTDNLVVIEAKKSTNTVDKDIEKLQAYKADLNYKYAIKIKLPVGDSIKNITDISEYIEFI